MGKRLALFLKFILSLYFSLFFLLFSFVSVSWCFLSFSFLFFSFLFHLSCLILAWLGLAWRSVSASKTCKIDLVFPFGCLALPSRGLARLFLLGGCPFLLFLGGWPCFLRVGLPSFSGLALSRVWPFLLWGSPFSGGLALPWVLYWLWRRSIVELHVNHLPESLFLNPKKKTENKIKC